MGAAVDGGYADVRQRGHDMGHGDNTRDAGGRNEMGGHVCYIEIFRFKHRGHILYVALIFQLVESLSYTLFVRMLRKEEVGGSRPPGSTSASLA